ncbi:hypothetical protein [Puia dinghuensis]|nr:hypothetical protein [Puia dinghuensis]
MKFRGVFFALLICTFGATAQDYQAINGSPYAGSMGVANNPATILSTPYPWDITVFSVQVKNTTNAITFTNLSYLTHGDTLGYSWTNGPLKRYASFNYNVHLLNVRLALDRKQAISFGANLRGYGSVRTGVVNYNDTLQDMNQFFSINEGNSYQASVVSSSWLELYGTYSRTMWDDEYGRLNAGVTLHAMRGISGAYAQLTNGAVRRNALDSTTIYSLAGGKAIYGYSANYDLWHNNNSTTKNLNDFLTHTQGGAAIDLGVEYLVKSQNVHVFGDEDDYYDYEWKLGAALMDIGANMYDYGIESRAVSNPKTTTSDIDLNEKFNYVKSFAAFNDSLATVVNTMTKLRGHFRIWNPARLVLNVDRPLPNHFALNTELTLNLGGNNMGQRLFTKEITLLAVTPRWETRRLGGYLPITVTTDGKVWIGGAFKAGPLLLGFHNWGDVFSKSKSQNGGFYLALVIRPGKGGFSFKEPKEYTCPKNGTVK